MNPILLKPSSDCRSQVVVNGKVWKTLEAGSYYEQFPFLLSQVLDAYERLAGSYDFVVMEGAGSVTELNLKHRDLVNLGLATRLGTPVLLVSDIDRGGVFASLVGTFALLESNENALVRGFAINRFRGDPALFASGTEILKQRTQRPCLGVFPYDPSMSLDAEDGVGIPTDESARAGTAEIAIVHLPHISNTTDFQLLRDAAWVSRPMDRQFKAVILPGTKNTIDDLAWLESTGLADWVKEQHKNGAVVVGVCGGYQMLGESVEDPFQVESSRAEIDGLGLLPCRTRLLTEKVTRRVNAVSRAGRQFSAYEIHMGETTCSGKGSPFARLSDGTTDGLVENRCIGTYLHGALEDAALVKEMLGVDAGERPSRDDNYERLARWFGAHVDRRTFEELYLCG